MRKCSAKINRAVLHLYLTLAMQHAQEAWCNLITEISWFVKKAEIALFQDMDACLQYNDDQMISHFWKK